MPVTGLPNQQEHRFPIWWREQQKLKFCKIVITISQDGKRFVFAVVSAGFPKNWGGGQITSLQVSLQHYSHTMSAHVTTPAQELAPYLDTENKVLFVRENDGSPCPGYLFGQEGQLSAPAPAPALPPHLLAYQL